MKVAPGRLRNRRPLPEEAAPGRRSDAWRLVAVLGLVLAALAVAMTWPAQDDGPQADDSIGPGQEWTEDEGEDSNGGEETDDPLPEDDSQEGNDTP